MPFLVPIGAAIAGAVGTAAAVAGAVVSAVGPVVSGIATAISVAGTVYSAVEGNVAGAVTGALTTTGLIAGGSINSIIKALKPAGAAAQAAGGLASVFGENTINEISSFFTSVVDPISKDILNTYNLVNGTVNTINTLAHEGIQGILAIPSAVAGAVGGIDQTFQRFGTVLGGQNASIAKDTLAPAMKDNIGDPVSAVITKLYSTVTGAVPEVGEIPKTPIGESLAKLAGLATSGKDLSDSISGTGWLNDALKTLLGLFTGLLGLAGFSESFISYAKQLGLQSNPIEPVDIGDIIRAVYRGQITDAMAVSEVSRRGLDAARYQLIKDLQIWLPDRDSALRLYYRGEIDEAEFTAALQKQGYSVDDIKALKAAFLEPVNPREAMAVNARQAMGEAGFLPTSYGSPPPAPFLKMYEPRFASPLIAQFDWLAHWKTPGIEWWITAYFRGLVTEEQVAQAATAENIPEEVVPKLVGVEQEVTQLWMIPDMLATGILTEAEGRSYLTYIGLAPRDTEVILKYGLAKLKAPQAAQAAALAGLSIGNAKTMFEDGIIDASEYEVILGLHGYAPEAAALTVALAKQELDLTSRTNTANLIVTQLELGAIDTATAQSQLYALSYTTAEVQKYLAQAQLALVKKTKVPTESELKAFWKHGIINDAQLVTGLEAIGWSPTYSQAFLTLYKEGG